MILHQEQRLLSTDFDDDYACWIQEQMDTGCFGVDFEAKPNQWNWTNSGL